MNRAFPKVIHLDGHRFAEIMKQVGSYTLRFNAIAPMEGETALADPQESINEIRSAFSACVDVNETNLRRYAYSSPTSLQEQGRGNLQQKRVAERNPRARELVKCVQVIDIEGSKIYFDSVHRGPPDSRSPVQKLFKGIFHGLRLGVHSRSARGSKAKLLKHRAKSLL